MSTINDVQKYGYRVRVIYLLNPHIIFIERLAEGDTGENIPNCFSQIGLQDVLPSSASYSEKSDDMSESPTLQWTPGTVTISREFIQEAKEIYYIPNLQGDAYKLFDNVPCTLGKLYLLRANDNSEELGEMLSKYTMTVYHSLELFKDLYITERLILRPNQTIISTIKRDLKEYILNQNLNIESPSIDIRCNSEEEVINMCCEISEAKKSFIAQYYRNVGREVMSKGFLSKKRKARLEEIRRNREKEYDEKLQLIKHPLQYVSCLPPISLKKLTFQNSSQQIGNTHSTVPVSKCSNSAPASTSKDTYTSPQSSCELKNAMEQPPNISKPIDNNLPDILRIYRVTRNKRSNNSRSNESMHQHSQERNAKSIGVSPIPSSEEGSSLLDSSSSSLHYKISDGSTRSDSKIQNPLTRQSQLYNCLKKISLTAQHSLGIVEQNQINAIENKNTNIQSQKENSVSDGSQNTDINKCSSEVYMKSIEAPREIIDGHGGYGSGNNTEHVSQPSIEINTKAHSISIEKSSLQKRNQTHDPTSVSNSQSKNTTSSGDKTISDSEDPDLSLSDAESVGEFDFHKYYLTKTSLQSTFSKITTKTKLTPDKKGIKLAFDGIASDNKVCRITEDPLLNFEKYVNNNKDNNKDDGKNKLKYPEVISDAPSETSTNNDILKQICTPTLMLHSKVKLPSRWLHINDATFTQILHENLSLLKIEDMKSSQTATWPIIMRGHDTLIIGPKGSGKTLGFVVPLCSMISNIDNMDSLTKRRGPLAWIVCSNFRTAMEIEKLCNKLLKGVVNENENINVVRLDTSSDDCDNACVLFSGCSILISTPYAVNMVDFEVQPLNLKRLLYLVFDDVDTLNKRYHDDVLRIHKICTEVAESRSGKGINIQMVATSCTWNDLMFDLSKPLCNPAICINAFKECTLYSNVEVGTAFVKSSNRTEELILYLNGLKEEFRKIIIVCSDDNDIKEIVISLEQCEYQVIKALSDMNLEDVFKVKNQWDNHTNYSRKLVLVCCDENLSFLNVSDANCLIHFSLPKSFFAFDNRFSTFVDNLPPLWDKNDDVVCKVLLFITELDQCQIPKLVNFLKRYGVNLDDDVNKMADAFLVSKEIDSARSAMPLCHELLKSGECFNDFTCIKRHMILPEFDKLRGWLPPSGYINFKIMHIHSPCYYSVRILSYLNAEGVKVNVEQNYLKLALDITIHYSKKKNRIPQTELIPGDICIAQVKMKQFFRCKIIKAVTMDKGHPQALVELIDQKNYTICDCSHLFQITEDFKNVLCTVVEICVAGLMPKDRDSAWSSRATKMVAGLFSDLSDTMFFRGRILLHIDKTLWLDNVQCCESMSSCNQVLVRISVKKYLIDNNIGVVNQQHMPLLYKLCNKVSWYIPNYDAPTKTKVKCNFVVEPSWAFLEQEVFSEVYFSCGINPSVFFIHIAKWRSCLNMLQKDIQKYAIQLQKSVVLFQPAEFIKGQYCIVKHSDDAFYRCRIDDVDMVDDSELLYVCFFVDYGDIERVKHSNVYPISAQLINQMPFQAIECRLLGLEKWSDMAIDSLYDMCFKSENSDILKVILAKYCLEEEALMTNGKKYAVYMFDPNSKDKESFYDFFVSNVLGEALDSEKALIDQAKKDMKDHIRYCLMQDEDCSDEYETDCYVKDSTDSYITLPSAETALVKVDRSQSSRCNKFNISSISDFETEEDVDDEWDVTFDILDYNILKNQERNLANIKEEIIPTKPKIVEISDDTNTSNLVGSEEKSGQVATKTENTTKSTGVIEMSSHKTPFVRWYETKSEMFLKIDLVGVEDYSIGITIAAINFECELRGTEYKLNINLVGGVIVDKCSHERKGLYIGVKLVKLVARYWLGLIKNVEKAPWLKPDYDICDGSDGEDPESEPFDMRKQTLERLTKADFDENNSDDEVDDDDREIVELLNELDG